MTSFRRLLTLLLLLAVAAPAVAQTVDVPARNGVPPRTGGGGFRGGRGGLGLGILPGLLLPAIAAGAAAAAAQRQDDGPPPRRRPGREPRKVHSVAHPHVVAPSGGQALSPPPGETRFATDEVLVLMRDDMNDRSLRAFGRRQKLDFVQSRKLTLIGQTVHRFRIPGGRDLRATLRKTARNPRVVLVQPDYLYRLQEDAPKPETPKPEAESAPGGYVGAALNLSQAHQIATGKGVRVAVIDSLVDAAHPELDGAVTDRFDALEGGGAEPQSHGTGMAGAIAGHKRLEGAAPQAQLLAVRAFGDRGDSTRAVGLDIAAGLDWAAASGAKVVNMSFAGPPDPLLAQMLAAAAKKHIALVAAAGNEGPQAQPLYPAAYADVIAVSAVDAQARLYDHANRGAYVALSAPGVDVLVAAPRGAYDLSTGTSVACAEVSGIVALLLEKQPGLDAAGLRRLLRESARALPTEKGAGAGQADALAAVERKN